MTNFKNQIAVKSKKLWQYFTTYEKIWFFVFVMATVLVSIFVPEETTNGISGTLLTIIYLVNVILGILCELLTSKQSKWSFFIYIFVEIIEIAKFILLSAMFSSMIVALFFWLPMHIISFISWHKHKDKKEQEKNGCSFTQTKACNFSVCWCCGVDSCDGIFVCSNIARQ